MVRVENLFIYYLNISLPINELHADKGVCFGVYYKQQNQNIKQVDDQFAGKENNHHFSQPLHSVVWSEIPYLP